MSVQTIHVTALAKEMFNIVNAVASFCNSSAWASAFTMFTMVSAVILYGMYSFKPDKGLLFRWVMGFIIVPCLLITPKVDVNIVNVSNPLEAYPVSNVPVGLAFPASMISTVIGYALPTTTADAYHSIDDQSYNNTGMIFAAKIFEETNRLELDSDAQGIFDSFLDNCVNTDILIRKKYTYKDLQNSPDIFEFFENQMTDNNIDRVNFGNDEFVQCSVALPRLKDKVLKSAEIAKHLIAVAATNSTSHSYDPNSIDTAIKGSYAQYFSGYAKTATATLMQNFAINSLKEGRLNNSVNHGSVAGITYALTQAQMNTTTQHWTMGRQAQVWIPQLQTVLFMLLIAAFPIIVLFMMFPETQIKIGKTYIDGMVWVSLWAVFFTYLNFIMQSKLSANSNLLMGTMTDPGFTLNMQEKELANTYQWTSITGYMMMFIPFISRMVTQPLSNIVGSLATSMMNNISGHTNAGVPQVVKGNETMGHVGVGDTSYNNLNANKHDTNERYGHGSITNQNQDISQTDFVNPGGHVNSTTVDSSAQKSNIGLEVNASHQLSAGASESAQRSESAAFNELATYGATNQLAHGESESVSSTTTQQYQQAVDNVNDFVNDDSISDSSSIASDLYAGVGTKFDSGNQALGKIGSLTTGVSMHMDAGGKVVWQGSDGQSHSMRASEVIKLADSMSVIKTAAQIENASLDDRSSVESAKRFDASMQSSYNSQQTANYAESSSASVNEDLNSQMSQWIIDNKGIEAAKEFRSMPYNSPERQQMTADAFDAVVGNDYDKFYQEHKSDIQNQALQGSTSTTTQAIHNNSVDRTNSVFNLGQQDIQREFRSSTLKTSLDDKHNNMNQSYQNHRFDSDNAINNAKQNIINDSTVNQAKADIDNNSQRKNYIDNLPKGVTSENVQYFSKKELADRRAAESINSLKDKG